MCKFFSAISNGKGKVLFFTLNDIKKIEKGDDPQDYNYNSHTSIAHYNSIKGKDEDNWNKWEYNPETKELKADSLVTIDDRKAVSKQIKEYLFKEGEMYYYKIYNRNSGDMNSGNRNSGNRNSGDWNSGDRNSGNRNSGNRNSGNRNSGNRNSGDWNSGNWNSGDMNSGNMNTNSPNIRMFNKQTKLKVPPDFPSYWEFELNEWVPVIGMTEDEKKKYYWYKTIGGYLRKIGYKEAFIASFNKASREEVEQTLKLPNFDYKIFEEISGITKKMIKDKLK